MPNSSTNTANIHQTLSRYTSKTTPETSISRKNGRENQRKVSCCFAASFGVLPVRETGTQVQMCTMV